MEKKTSRKEIPLLSFSLSPLPPHSNFFYFYVQVSPNGT